LTFNLYQLIIIIGITQGVLTSVLMIQTKAFQPHQRLLGLVVLVFVLVNMRYLILSHAWPGGAVIQFVPLGLELFIPPMLYLYVCNITTIKNTPPKPWKWHLLLPLCWLAYDLLFFIIYATASATQRDLLPEQWWFGEMNHIEDYLILLSTWFYWLLGARRYRWFVTESESMAPRQRGVLRRWLLQILAWMLILGVFYLINHGLDLAGLWQAARQNRWQLFTVFLALTTYYLGFLGYRLQSPRLFEAINSLKSQVKKKQQNNHDDIEQKLQQLMQAQAIYLDPDINLKQVAVAMGVSTESLSFLLNQKLKITFRDYLNQHRIAAVQKQIDARTSKTELSSQSILDMALAAGFNSQASFYRAFKKFVGQTPLQYSQRSE